VTVARVTLLRSNLHAGSTAKQRSSSSCSSRSEGLFVMQDTFFSYRNMSSHSATALSAVAVAATGVLLPASIT
jgi:hypothetical protein